MRISIRNILAAIFFIMLTGCATSGRIGELPMLAQSDPGTTLVIMRIDSFIGVTNSYYVALDGRDIFSIRSGEHTKFKIPAGEHFISVKCFGGWTPTWKAESIKFNAIPGGKNFFEISPNISCAGIRAIEEDVAVANMKSSKFVSPDKISDK